MKDLGEAYRKLGRLQEKHWRVARAFEVTIAALADPPGQTEHVRAGGVAASPAPAVFPAPQSGVRIPKSLASLALQPHFVFGARTISMYSLVRAWDRAGPGVRGSRRPPRHQLSCRTKHAVRT